MLEVGKEEILEGLRDTVVSLQLTPEETEYAERIVLNCQIHGPEIDEKLAALIPDYDYSRIAVVDRNVLRIAACEFLYEPGMPPAVTIDEAIEIARKYSTAESGKFVNGVLASLLAQTPKAEWDPSMAEVEEKPEAEPEEAQAPVEEELSEEAAQELLKAGPWRLRAKE